MTPTYHTSFSVQEQDHQQCDDDQMLASDQSDGNTTLKGEERSGDGGGNVLSIKWMSSKMRLMKKMMNNTDSDKPTSSTLDTDHSSNNTSSTTNIIVRTCSDCNTTKTPLWRSGPRGPKSLCNACGIRQRKARRAMAAAATTQGEGNNETVVLGSQTSSNKLQIKAKRCKLAVRRNRKKLCFEDLIVSLSKNTAYHQVFPPDEKEAAILLMALSCGLAHG